MGKKQRKFIQLMIFGGVALTIALKLPVKDLENMVYFIGALVFWMLFL